MRILGLAIVSLLFLNGCKIKVREGLEDSFPASVSSLFIDFSPQIVSLTRTAPDISIAASANPSPNFSGRLDREGYISLFSDDQCRNVYSTVKSGVLHAFSMNVDLAGTADGNKKFYYKTYEPYRKVWSSCQDSNLGYRFQAVPIVSFSRSAYTLQDSGDWLGTPLKIVRDVGGIATNGITIDLKPITAQDGVHMALRTATADFSADDSDKEIAFNTKESTSLAPTEPFVEYYDLTASTDVDRYFIAKISSAGNGALGTQKIAQVNFLDADSRGEYQFNHSFYSVTDTSSTVSLVVQRKDTTAAASIGIEFVDGSAGASDYDNRALTADFDVGEDEVTIDVPIYNVTSNKSFFAKLVTTSARTVRAQSIAKVRILDSAESTTCTTFAGTGTAVDPYLVCNSSDFMNMAGNGITAHYKLMADIEDGDTIVPFSTFEGGLDGNEHFISQFTYTGIGAGDGTRGIFSSAKSATGDGVIQNLNLLYYRMTNVGSQVGSLIGENGVGGFFPLQLSNIYASGYISSLGTEVGGLVGVQDSSPAATQTSLQNILTAGFVDAGSDRIAGVVGRLTHASGTGSVILKKLHSVASNPTGFGSDNAGGLFGIFHLNTASATISALENRGAWAARASAGGLIGSATFSGVLTLESLKNYGLVNGTNEGFGGVFGLLAVNGDVTLSEAHNYGYVSGQNESAGGIAGLVNLSTWAAALRISTASNAGVIHPQGSYGGGILGYVSSTESFTQLLIDHATNAGGVTTASGAGGIVGYISTVGVQDNQTYSISDSSNTGNLNATTGPAGGILGAMSSAGTSANNQLTISDSSSTGTSTGGHYVGGIIGDLLFSDAFGNVGLSNLTSNVAITTTNPHAGGILGRLSMSATAGHSVTLAITDSVATGTISGSAYIGGLVGELPARNAAGIVAITSSSSSIALTGTTALAYMGGLVGYMPVALSAPVSITSSKFTGSLTNNTAAASRIGGLIGNTVNDGTGTLAIEKCSVTANITTPTSATLLGGMIGSAVYSGVAGGLSIKKSYFSGDISGNQYIGGMFGVATLSNFTPLIQNSYVTGTLTSSNAANNGLGGFVGRISGSSNVAFTNVYSLANLVPNGAANVGGLYGMTGNAPTITSSFWRKDGVYNTAIVADGNEKSDIALQTSTVYTGAGWDLGGTAANIWQILTYPFLSGMP